MSTRLLLACLLAALAVACGGPPSSAREAQRRLEAGDLSGAEQIVEQELLSYPKEPLLWNVRIRVHLARGDAARAVAAYREWRELRRGHDRGALRAMALSTLWQGMGSPSAEVKIAAIEAAVALDAESLAERVSQLLDDDHEQVKATAAAALLRSHPDAPTILTEALESDDPRARAIAVEALGRKVGRAAREEILSALGDADANVRVAAIGAFAAILEGGDGARLAEMAAKDPDGRVRAAALRALARARWKGAVAVAREALADAYLGARLAAVETLKELAGQEARAELARLAAGTDPFLALRAGVALARLGDRGPGRAALERALAAEDWTIRAAGLNAAAELAPREQAVALVAPLARDPEPAVRLAAARALERLGRGRDAAAIWAEALAWPDEALRLQAAADLMRAGDPRGRAALEALATTASPATRRQAVASLAAAREPTDGAIAALADENGLVRVAAALTLLSVL